MRIVISGATGFLGSFLRKKFAQNHQVISIVRNTDHCPQPCILADRLQSMLLFKPDIVIHTAASYGRQQESKKEIYNTNILFSQSLLEYAVESGVRLFINIGTYLSPEINYYAYTKHQFSALGMDIAKNTDTCFLDLHCNHFYGYGAGPANFLYYVASNCRQNNDIELTSGTQKRDFIYIEDFFCILDLIINNQACYQESLVVPVGSGESPVVRSVVEYIHYLLQAENKLLFGALPLRDHETDSCVNIEFLQKIGFQLRYSWKLGIYDWFAKEGWIMS
ncbi:NAD dependent epimerase/dehydratase family protein [Brevinema andersonii]|uniref:NAD dependent epimerase/dehydratase family protein n=1 Tax=Brevinema andersonii TaxID=34097 RepID=A0A1I1CY57_BREAD|nr:NAD-dependent epimerase/dehydratase family protein [Brevinema andersonii]SFB67454.1 NAD dependent epimerase/dehydratase family protein [Brevinema andersonii]